MQDQMFGVVLWADTSEHKAVIWCEDHGNLAYYTGGEQSLHDGINLDAGDLIQFDLREERDMRRARNLRRVDAGHAPTLAKDLCECSATDRVVGNNVVKFPTKRRVS